MKKNFRIKSLITTLLITLISLNIGMSVDWSNDDQYLYVQEWQVLTWSSLLDIVSHRIHRILIIIIFAVWIISLCVVLKTKDKEKRRKTKKVSIIVTFCAVLISIIYDIISWWLRVQGWQTLYGSPTMVEKPTYPEDTLYSLPEPKTSVINMIVNLAQWIIPIITFIIWIVSFIRILMIKDEELKKKRIRNTTVILSVLIILIVVISVVARLLNK